MVEDDDIVEKRYAVDATKLPDRLCKDLGLKCRMLVETTSKRTGLTENVCFPRARGWGVSGHGARRPGEPEARARGPGPRARSEATRG